MSRMLGHSKNPRCLGGPGAARSWRTVCQIRKIKKSTSFILFHEGTKFSLEVTKYRLACRLPTDFCKNYACPARGTARLKFE